MYTIQKSWTCCAANNQWSSVSSIMTDDKNDYTRYMQGSVPGGHVFPNYSYTCGLCGTKMKDGSIANHFRGRCKKLEKWNKVMKKARQKNEKVDWVLNDSQDDDDESEMKEAAQKRKLKPTDKQQSSSDSSVSSNSSSESDADRRGDNKHRKKERGVRSPSPPLFSHHQPRTASLENNMGTFSQDDLRQFRLFQEFQRIHRSETKPAPLPPPPAGGATVGGETQPAPPPPPHAGVVPVGGTDGGEKTPVGAVNAPLKSTDTMTTERHQELMAKDFKLAYMRRYFKSKVGKESRCKGNELKKQIVGLDGSLEPMLKWLQQRGLVDESDMESGENDAEDDGSGDRGKPKSEE